ncbi:MAG TPA: helix-hairpin-helix domain-containing protein [Paraburkholderia sp.]
MLKKLLMLFVVLGLTLSAALASAVEVNTADEATLETVKGIGPAHAKAIIDERTKNGPFRSVDDLVDRVKGIGPKSVQNLEAAGLTINGSSAPPSGKTTKGGKTAKSMAPAATNAAPPAATQAPSAPATAPATTANTTAEPATATKKHRGRKAAAAASEPAAATTAPATAAAANAASDGKAKKSKHSRKSKAASAAAASGD